MICCPAYAQSKKGHDTKEVYDSTKEVHDWECVNKGHWGSFWWKVERTVNKIDGFYYYYVYMQSNSYFNQTNSSYIKATTYVEGVTITMLDNIKGNDLFLDYLLFDWDKNYVAYFYHPNPYKKFSVNYYAVYPYSYSKNGKY